MTFRELIETEKDLSGYSLVFAYFMTNTFLGHDPVVLRSNRKQIVVCKNRDDLRKIWYNIPKQFASVTRLRFLINSKEKIAVYMPPNGDKDYHMENPENVLFIFDSVQLEEYLKQKDFFAWESDKLNSSSEPEARFPETNGA